MNLLEQVSFGNNKTIEFLYLADGTKLRKTVNNNGGITTIDYLSGKIYQDQTLQYISTEEGRAIQESGGDFRFEYHFTDHLGNLRSAFSDLDDNGAIDPNNEVLQLNDYYPFGLEHYCTGKSQIGPLHKFTYTGKEFNDDLGLNWYDHGWRSSDPALGRWHGTDPLAEKFPWISGYAAFSNNPIFYVDPDGRENVPALLWAMKNMANKGISSNYGNPYFAGSDSRWTYKVGNVPDRTVCYESCFMAYMNSGNDVLPTLRTGFTNKNNAFKGRSSVTGGMNWFKSGDGTDRSFVTDIGKGELGDVVFMGEVAAMQGHAVLLAGGITMGPTEIDGKTIETATFYTLSTSSDSDSGNYGGREFTFNKQLDGTWQQQGGEEYTFNGYGQMNNVDATDAQRQEAAKSVEEIKKGN